MGYKLFPVHSPAAGVTGCDCKAATCTSPAKHPRTLHGKDDATDHLDQLTVWFGQQWPHANIGLVTGAASGVVVLDVDPRNGGDVELDRLQEAHAPFPMGPVAATGGGGWHYFFKHPGTTVRSRNGAVGEGLDVKADGGYVIAPPSVHRTGLSYDWCEGRSPWEVDTPELPTWLLLLMTQDNGSPYEGVKEVPHVIREGMRRTQLLSLAGSMRHRNMGEKAIFAALMAENEEKCSPPLEATEVAGMAASARQWPPGEATLLSSNDDKRPRAAKERYDPSPFSARELQAMVLPAVRWVIPGLLPEGAALLAGRPKLGKSWWAFNIGVAVSEGGIAMGEIPCEDGDVLILALEDTKRRLQSRLKMMLGGEAWPERLAMETKWPRQGEGGLEAIDAWLGLHAEARMVVIDTLAKFKPPAKGGKRGDVYAEDYATIEGLQELAGKHGVCILMITHYNKGMHDDWINAITSSSGTTGSADTLLGLERPRGLTGQKEAVLHVTGRDVEEGDFAVQFDGSTGTWTIIGDAEDARVGRETALLLAAMASAGHSVTPKEVALALSKTLRAAEMLLYRAARDGHIEDHGHKVYGLLIDRSQTSFVTDVIDVITHHNDHTNHKDHKITSITRVGDLASNSPDSHILSSAKSASEADSTLHVTSQSDPEPFVRDVTNSAQERRRPRLPCGSCGKNAWVFTVSGWACPECRPHERRVEQNDEA